MPVNSAVNTMPVYIKACVQLFLLMLIGMLLYWGRDIMVPFAFALLVAVLLLPLNKWLETKKCNRVLAISFTVFITVVFFIALFYFLTTQLIDFTQDIPAIKKQLSRHLSVVQSWLSAHFNITRQDQAVMVNDAADNIKASGVIGNTVLSVTEIISVLVLVPVYVFLLLYYRDMIYTFFLRVFGNNNTDKVKDVLKESRYIVQGYMFGLLIEMGIVALINAAGLLALGVQYAVFLGVFAALLNMIPYVGMLIASVFCALVTLSTSNQLSDVVGVVVILTVVQFVDNNVIMPRVVSSKVKINALITILGVLIGGALAGVAGMFLSIPTIAILKVIFDRTDGMQPWGLLLGDEVQPDKRNIFFKKRLAAPLPPAEQLNNNSEVAG
jgi:predicted PurR-regulated permease PerM